MAALIDEAALISGCAFHTLIALATDTAISASLGGRGRRIPVAEARVLESRMRVPIILRVAHQKVEKMVQLECRRKCNVFYYYYIYYNY